MPDDSVLLGELAEEFSLRVRQGQMPDVEEYARAHPELAARIRELFPALMFLEGMAGGAGTPDSVSAAASTDLAAGQSFGAYRIEQEIGRGGMGVVYEAVHLALGRRVAMKVLAVPAPGGGGQLERFLREARTAAGLHHTNIVPIFDVGQVGGTPYYAMQLIDGQGLDQVLRQGDPDRTAAEPVATGGPPVGPGTADRRAACRHDRADFRWVADIGIQAAEGLAYAHHRGVIHRDIKPSNLLLDQQGVVWITDFGLARRLDDPALTHSGMLLGTPRYMSPEQAEAARRPVDHRTDLYSLGATLYELLTRRPAFEGETAQEVVNQILHREPIRPRGLNPAVPRDLETIVLKAMAKRPEDRYQTAADLADDLRRWQRLEPIRARRIGPVGRTIRWCRRNPKLAAISGAAVLIILTLSSLYAWGLNQQIRATHEALARAQAAREEARQRLVRQYVANGARHMDEGDVAGAMLWFAEALNQDQGDATREEMHRIRLGTLLRQQPRLVHVLVHAPAVGEARFSPDSRRLFTRAGDPRIWDVVTGEPVTPPLKHPHYVSAAHFSPDGRRLLTVSMPPDPKGEFEGEARVYDTASGELLFPPLKHANMRLCAAFSPDGHKLLTASTKEVSLWDAATGRALLPPLLHDLPPAVVTFSPDGRFILTSSNDSANRVETRWWDAATGKPVIPPLANHLAAREGAFSPDGRRLLTWTYGWGPRHKRSEFHVQVWDTATGQPAGPPLKQEAEPLSAAFSPDGRWIATFCTTAAQVWEAGTGKPVGPRIPPDQVSSGWAFSPDGQRLLTAGPDSVHIGDVAQGKMVFTHAPSRPLQTPPFTPDGRRLLLASNGVTLVDPDTRRATRLSPGHHDTYWALSSPDGRWLLTHSHDGTARLWDLVPLGPSLRPFPDLEARRVTSIAFSPDGKRLAIAGSSPDSESARCGEPVGGSVQVCDTATGEPLLPRMDTPTNVRGLVFSPDGRQLVGLRWDENAPVWDTATGKTAYTLGQAPELTIQQAAFRADGRQIITVCGDGTLRTWDAATGEALGQPLKVEAHNLTLLSSDGERFFLARQDGSAVVCQTATGEPVVRLGKPAAEVIHQAAFSRDGSRLVTVGSQVARIWNTATGGLAAPLLRGVQKATFSPDGRLLLTKPASGLHQTQIWDAATGEPVTPPFATGQLPVGTSHDPLDTFTPDGRHLVAVADGALHEWDLRGIDWPAADLLRLAEVLAGQRVDAVGGSAPLEPAEVADAWKDLRTRHGPESLRASPSQVLAWHERQAWEVEGLLWKVGGPQADAGTSAASFAALFHLDRLIEARPGEGRLYARRAVGHLGLGRYSAAVTDCSKAIELGTAGWQVWLRRSLAHAGLKQMDEAGADFARAVELGMREGGGETWQCTAAVRGLDRLIEADPKNVELHRRRALMHGELGQWDRAAADYTTIIELGAADYNVLVQRGSVYSVMRQWDRAIADYTRAIDLGVRYVWDWRGSAHAELGRWDEAAADFARAIEVGDAPGEAWYHRALVLLKQGDRQGYRTLCTDMLKRFDRLRNPRAFANMVGALLLAPGAIADPKRLPDLTEQALTNDLPDFDAGLMQGAALYRANQVDTAVERLKEAVTVKREAPAAWFFLAMAQHRLGKAGEARQAFDRAVQATDRAAAGKPPLSWDERLILELLRREAEALLGKAP